LRGELNVSCELTNGLSQWPGQVYNRTGTNYTQNVTIIWHKLCATTLFGDLIDEWGDLHSTMVNGTTEWAAENLTATGGNYPEVGTWELDWQVLNGTPGNRTWCHGENWNGDVVNNTFTVSPIWNNDNCLISYAPRNAVTFLENGLPGGTTWSITINGSTFPISTQARMIVLPNGTYPYEVGNVSGYSASPSTGFLTLDGVQAEVTINFTSTTASTSPTPLVVGLPPQVAYVVLGTSFAAVAIALGLSVWRRGRLTNREAHQDQPPTEAR